MFGSWIRRTAFWTIDTIKGSPVSSQYKDIEEKSRDSFNNRGDLQCILAYAVKHVPYYKGMACTNLDQFPVMKKAIYKKNPVSFISDEYKDLSVLHKVSTSGSTGEPMVVYQNREKRDRVKADLIRAHEMVGWNLGRKYIFIRNWVSNYHQSKAKVIAQNVVPVSIANFDDNSKLRLIYFLKKHKGTVLFGYSSSICDFMNFTQKRGIDGISLKLRVIVCDSDELTNKNKKRLNDCFGCTVINRYDNEENGLIAITSIDDDTFHVNYQGLYIELLENESNRSVQPGQMGRVVITDLHNKAMPLIRYDTGDYAVSMDNPGNIRTLKEISGRQVSSLTAINGNIVSSVAISGITEVFNDIEKYQIEQITKIDFEFRYVGKLNTEEETELSSRLHNCLGKTARVKVVCVNEIEKGSNGKYKTLINSTV